MFPEGMLSPNTSPPRRGSASLRPLVSVAMISFNHVSFVAEAVESVLNQTLRDLELIVVDDGSTDGTPDVVARIDDPRLKLVRLERNRERHARNLALSMCSGKYVAFQNSDDIWATNKLQRQVDELETSEDYAVCFTNARIINTDGKPDRSTWAEGIFKNVGTDGCAWLREFFYKGNCLCLPSALVRASNLKKVGHFRESLIQQNDVDLWVRLAAVGDFLVIDEELTSFRVVGLQNVSAPTSIVQCRVHVEVSEVLRRYTEPMILERFSELFPELGLGDGSEAVKRAALARISSQMSTPHRIFADRVWQELFDSPHSRSEVIGHFGTEIFFDFLSNRAKLGSYHLSAAAHEAKVDFVLSSAPRWMATPLRLGIRAIFRLETLRRRFSPVR